MSTAADLPDVVWSQHRPTILGRVEWTLVAGAEEVKSAAGMPRRVHEELTGLLDGLFGEKAGELANRTAVLARALVLAGAAGSMRLTGSPSHVLVELVGVSRAGSGAAPSSGADLFALAGPGQTHGRYSTLGETRSEHVAWGMLALPARPGDTALVAVADVDDLWS